jgi:hypothetical protein
MRVLFPKGTLYDSEGKEIKVPEGHQGVYGKDSMTFVKVDGYETKFVYRPPAYPEPIAED